MTPPDRLRRAEHCEPLVVCYVAANFVISRVSSGHLQHRFFPLRPLFHLPLALLVTSAYPTNFLEHACRSVSRVKKRRGARIGAFDGVRKFCSLRKYRSQWSMDEKRISPYGFHSAPRETSSSVRVSESRVRQIARTRLETFYASLLFPLLLQTARRVIRVPRSPSDHDDSVRNLAELFRNQPRLRVHNLTSVDEATTRNEIVMQTREKTVNFRRPFPRD